MEAIETLFSSLLLVDKQMRCVSGQAGGALPFPVEFVLMFTNHALWDIKRTSAVSPSQVLKSHGCQVFSPSGPCFFLLCFEKPDISSNEVPVDHYCGRCYDPCSNIKDYNITI